jgi:hypothetical protein
MIFRSFAWQAIFIVAAVFAVYGGQTEFHATGYRMMTHDDSLWFDQHGTSSYRVELNDLGAARINEYLRAHGKPARAFHVVKTGEEMVPLAPSLAKKEKVNAVSAVQDIESVLPDHVDNSTMQGFPPIGNQGNLGCCSAFSMTYYVLTHMVNFTYNRLGSDPANQCSPKWTYDLIVNGTDQSTDFTHVFRIVTKNGCASWKQFPYDQTCASWCTIDTVWRSALKYRIGQIGTCGLLQSSDQMTSLKQVLANGYVVGFSTSITDWKLIKIKQSSSSSVNNSYVGKDIVAWTTGGCDHAMTIVGYDDRIWADINGNGVVDSGELGALRIANQWGTSYEDHGYMWIAYDALTKQSKVPGYVNSSKGDLIVETKWITVKPNYSPRLIAQCSLNHAKRDQITVTLGYSPTSRTTPVATWKSEAVFAKGGDLAFNGATTAMDGSFAFDYTDLIDSNKLATATTWRWYIMLSDLSNDGSPLTVKDFRVIDPAKNNIYLPSTTFPQTADGSTVTLYADAAFDTIATLASVNSPSAVTAFRIACSGPRLLLCGIPVTPSIMVSVFDCNGRMVYRTQCETHDRAAEVGLPRTLAAGPYVCSVARPSGPAFASAMVIVGRR